MKTGIAVSQAASCPAFCATRIADVSVSMKVTSGTTMAAPLMALSTALPVSMVSTHRNGFYLISHDNRK